MKSNVAVVIEVFNEESRIEGCLQSFEWADEIVVVDKSSTDKTVELSKKYTDKVYVVPYTETMQFVEKILQDSRLNSDWYLFITASSAIEPKLVNELVKLTALKEFPFDVISLPLKIYVLGISSKYSPWDTKAKDICFRKNAVHFSTEVHKETGHRSQNIYRKLLELDSFYYHFTHRQVDVLLERCARYTRQESKAQFEDGNIVLRKDFIAITKAFFYVTIKRKVFLMGWDGVALGVAYLIYFMMKFLYSWEKFRGLGSGTYSREIDQIKKKWAKNEN